MVVLDILVCWALDCIQKKPGERGPASETHRVPGRLVVDQRGAGGGYPGCGVVHSGTDPSGAPWYGSGCPISLVLPCFAVFCRF